MHELHSTRFSPHFAGDLDISHIGKVVVRHSDWGVCDVRGFRFGEPSALAAGFGADDSTYSVIVKCQPFAASTRVRNY